MGSWLVVDVAADDDCDDGACNWNLSILRRAASHYSSPRCGPVPGGRWNGKYGRELLHVKANQIVFNVRFIQPSTQEQNSITAAPTGPNEGKINISNLWIHRKPCQTVNIDPSSLCYDSLFSLSSIIVFSLLDIKAYEIKGQAYFERMYVRVLLQCL